MTPTPRRILHRRTAALTLAASLLVAPAVALAPAPAAQADTWRDAQNWIEDYGFDTAWETTRGEGVTVAIIDTGVDSEHPDLVDKVKGGTDMSGLGPSNGTGPMPFDPDHGTMVASLLAGHGNNLAEIAAAEEEQATASPAPSDDDEAASASPTPDEIPDPGPGDDGIIGTAPAAQLLTVSLDLSDDAEKDSMEQIAQGVIWAVDQGADVINISLASSEQDWPESWDEAFTYAEDHDVVVVAAAGNRAGGSDVVGAPATVPGVLTVAGVDANGEASWDSSTEGITVGVAAQSDPLVGALRDGGYAEWAGTSGAAPIVSGLVALVRSAHPDLDAANVINRILATAHDAGDPGADPFYGHGIIDADAAVNATDIPQVSENPMGSLHDWIRIHRRGSLDDPSPNADGAGHDSSDPHLETPPYPTALPVSASGDAALEDEDSGIGAAAVTIIIAGTAVTVAAIIGAIVFSVRARRQLEDDQ